MLGELVPRARAHVGPLRHPRAQVSEKVILVLDELDYLVTTRQSVIYNLFEWATRGASSLVVVGISNTMDLPERLLPRVESRLNIRRVNFLPYSHADISAIIIDRLGSLDAFAAGEEEFSVELAGRTFSQQPQKYHMKSLAALREKYAAADGKAALDPVLAEAGCLSALQG